MKSVYQTYATDPKLEAETGIALDYGELGTFFVKRAGGANRSYAQRLAALTKPYQRQIDSNTLDPKISLGLMAKLYSEHVVIGWQGVSGPDNEPLIYSREACEKLFNDLPDLFADIQKSAQDMQNFLIQKIEDNAKN